MEARLGSRRYGSIEDFQGSTASSSAALDLDVEAQPAAFPPRRRWVKAATVILGGIAAVSATTRAGLYTTSEPSSQASLLATTATTPSATTPLAFTAVNFYHVRDGTPAVGYYPWLKDMKLIEPHRDTTLSVANPREGVDYRWQIRGDSTASPVHTSASGAEAVVVLERENLDKNLVTLEEVDVATGAVSRRVDEFVMVKYVRREIRTLTDEEREELFDAVSGDKKVLRNFSTAAIPQDTSLPVTAVCTSSGVDCKILCRESGETRLRLLLRRRASDTRSRGTIGASLRGQANPICPCLVIRVVKRRLTQSLGLVCMIRNRCRALILRSIMKTVKINATALKRDVGRGRCWNYGRLGWTAGRGRRHTERVTRTSGPSTAFTSRPRARSFATM